MQVDTDGEIPFLDADPLTNGIEAPVYEESLDPDERAIDKIARKLRQKGGRSEEQIEETSVALYNKICQDLRIANFPAEGLKNAAELFGEDTEQLLERLRASE